MGVEKRIKGSSMPPTNNGSIGCDIAILAAVKTMEQQDVRPANPSLPLFSETNDQVKDRNSEVIEELSTNLDDISNAQPNPYNPSIMAGTADEKDPQQPNQTEPLASTRKGKVNSKPGPLSEAERTAARLEIARVLEGVPIEETTFILVNWVLELFMDMGIDLSVGFKEFIAEKLTDNNQLFADQ
ncbi:uncharacterized protein BDZ83DRAFT_732893 [Colletotrichum acutatum]|uniref:Uncharacterized protein n=1 Tax=Glomerella acutata TaxID=27357 RepID=A0AAD8XET2_GLOAC|nr:uncharacterized protein BDZ83DRAFT_732893 [Colletotrichum acutatum]KAK1721342.1 hypothetical protein BDZ83DRAFT_732893 [Colletotrichum acutatum]